jgi:calcineurin-like phosphoesterase family protein
MNAEIIRRWNERVKPEDIVYFLGDFNFKSGSGRGQGEPIKAEEIRKQLNGDIIFIQGNHDHSGNGITTRIKAILLEAGGINIYCIHNPLDSNNTFPLNLCGHVHEKWKSRPDTKFGMKTFLINVGVDVRNFYPISLDEVLKEYNEYVNSKRGYHGKGKC